jgi:hypothetical protein
VFKREKKGREEDKREGERGRGRGKGNEKKCKKGMYPIGKTLLTIN